MFIDQDAQPLVDALFHGAKGPSERDQFCHAIAKAVGADAFNLSISDAQNRALLSTATNGSALIPPSAFEDYNRRWLQSDPQVRLALSKKLAYGEVYLCSEHFNAEARKAEPFFSEFLAGLGVAWCAGYLAQLDDAYAIGFLAYRAAGRPPFDQASKRLMTPIALTLNYAGDAMVRAQRYGVRERASLLALENANRDAVCLDHRGRVLWASQGARAELNETAVLRLRDAALTSPNAEGLKALKDGVRRAAIGAPLDKPVRMRLTARTDDGEKSLALTLHSVRADSDPQWGGALLTLDSRIDRDDAQALSKREREIVTRVASGVSAAQAARDLSIREATARTFLRRAFRKLGVKNQRDLVRRFQNDPPPESD